MIRGSSSRSRANSRSRSSDRGRGRRGGARTGSRSRTGSRTALIAGAVLTAIPIAVALLGPLLAPHNPDATLGRPLAGPGSVGLLGTDQLGRDVLSRVLYGGRTTLGIALVAALGAELMGVAGGIAVAASGRLARALTGYLSRVLLAIPGILLLSVLVAGFGHSSLVMMVGAALALTPPLVPLIATRTQTLIAEPFVESAVLSGSTLPRLARRELLPNLAPIIAADFVVRLLTSVFLICAAGFIGLGPAPPTPEWGLMIADAEATMQQQPWPIIAPALLLACLAAGLMLLSHAFIAYRTGASGSTASRPGSSVQDPRRAGGQLSEEALEQAATDPLRPEQVLR